MGIPAYFRWISEKYPHIMVDCVENVAFDDVSTMESYDDASQPNPNGQEFDNLYLDMNGIIHPCTHPEDRPPPTTEEEMFEAIFDYIDRIFAIIRPRRLLYMAIDGVAPRAKINQQRSRRFRAAQEAREKREAAVQLAKEWRKMGIKVQEDDNEHMPFDSNVITPGTPFMANLSVALRSYVKRRCANTPGWQNIVIIFSDASVPGEGEHKIAQYIRYERAQPGYDPNLKHVMYGLDADLIMLALATHEVFFTILREEVFPKRKQRSSRFTNNSSGHNSHQSAVKTRLELGGRKPFHFLHVHVLREYLDSEFKGDVELVLNSLPSEKRADISYDLERVIDDFVFMCFFVGNDFLPHLPTFDIREGAIDYLIELYKNELPRMGYLTSSQGDVNFDRARRLLLKMAGKEDDLFRERARREADYANRIARENAEKEAQKKRSATEMLNPAPSDSSQSRKKKQRKYKDAGYQDLAESLPMVSLGRPSMRIGSGEARRASEEKLSGKHKNAKSNSSTADPQVNGAKEISVAPVSSIKSKVEFDATLKERLEKKNKLQVYDNVKLHEQGWKERYYSQKFEWNEEHVKDKRTLLLKYHEGLLWVMKYYYVGCVSWDWYYPYHYAPFASDLVESDVTADDIEFEEGKPYEPFSQLQSVMPASSGKIVLPECYHDLMVNPNSPVIDYYPEDFKVDLNGKKFAWQGVVLLPFIDKTRLSNALEPLKQLLTDEEKKRNSFGIATFMTNRETGLGKRFSKRTAKPEDKLKRIPEELAGGQLFGRASYALQEFGGHEESVITVQFELPKYSAHVSEMLPGANVEQKHLDDVQKAEAKYTGWKTAKFGPLGRAAKELRQARLRNRSSTARYGQHSTRGGRDHGYPGRNRPGSYPSDRPVINRPFANYSQNMPVDVVQSEATPGWQTGGRYSNSTSRGRPQSGDYGRQYYDHVSQLYGVHTDPYRDPSQQGGYYGSAGNADPHGQGAWGYGAGWGNSRGNRGRGAARGGSARGGGLSGPTAESMRRYGPGENRGSNGDWRGRGSSSGRGGWRQRY